MNKVSLSKEFSQILAKYLKVFKLEPIDMAYLIGTKKGVIDGLLNNEKGVVQYTLEQIAQVFGLRYFEFCNPAHPIPKISTLPEKTKQRIAFRKSEGPFKEKSYSSSDINEQIRDILSKYAIGEEFLAENISKDIFEKYGYSYTVSEIIDRFKKTFKDNIKKTDRKDTVRVGRGPKPVFYRLVKL